MRTIVTFTTERDQINTASLVVKNLLNQTYKPDQIVLYIVDKKVSEIDIPVELSELIGDVFQIRFVDTDLKTHNSYYYAMKDYPKDVIITVVNGFDYPVDTIELLREGHKQFPDSIVCLKGNTIPMNAEDDFLTYSEWKDETKIVGKPSHAIMASFSAGVLYPENCFEKSKCSKSEILGDAFDKAELYLKMVEVENDRRVLLLKEKHIIRKLAQNKGKSFWETVSPISEDEFIERRIKELGDRGKEIRRTIFRDYLADILPIYRSKATQLKKKDNEIKKIKATNIYKTGRIVTVVPRKIKRLQKKLKNNRVIDGAIYDIAKANMEKEGLQPEFSRNSYLKSLNGR